MPTPRKWPPSIRHHRNSGQAFCRIDGRNHYLGKWGSSEVHARFERLVRQHEGGMKVALTRACDVPTINDVVAAWFEQEAPRYDPSGREPTEFKRSLEPLLHFWGDLPAGEFDAGKLEGLQLAMARGWGDRKPLCRSTINQRVNRIRTVWRWAERRDLVPKGAWWHLRTLPGLRRGDPRARPSTVRRPCTMPELAAVLCHCGPKVRTMLRLMAWTGMRSGEVRRMQMDELDGETYRPEKHKTLNRGHERTIILGPRAMASLRWWLRIRGKAPGPVFPSLRKPGVAMTLHSFSREVRKAADRAGVPSFTSYRLRHLAKKRITRAMGLDAARAALGHSSIGTTNGYAAEIDLDLAREAARKFG